MAIILLIIITILVAACVSVNVGDGKSLSGWDLKEDKQESRDEVSDVTSHVSELDKSSETEKVDKSSNTKLEKID